MDAHAPQQQETPSENAPGWGLWSTLAWSAGAALVLVASQTAGAVLYLAWRGSVAPAQPIAVDELQNNGAMLASAFLFSTPLLLAYLAFAVRLSRVSFREYMALKWPGWRDMLTGVGALAAVIFVAGTAATLTGQQTPDFMGDTYRTARDAGMLPLFFFSFVVLAPVQEELIFRGFMFRGVQRALGPWIAIVLTAAVWAVVHPQYEWFYVAEIFLLGVAFGWLRARTGSALLTMLLHAGMNAMAIAYAGTMATAI
jgi:membrane protease YdiL (CAAX protease family)